MSEEKEEKKKVQSAKEIAEIMVANMKANMEDPDFWLKRERRRQKALKEVLKKRQERNKNEEQK